MIETWKVDMPLVRIEDGQYQHWQKSNAASTSKGIMQKAEVISAVPTYPSYRTSG